MNKKVDEEFKGINEFLQMSMTNNMPLSVNEKRQIFDLIINLQIQLQKKDNIINELENYFNKIKDSRTLEERMIGKYMLKYIKQLKGENYDR